MQKPTEKISLTIQKAVMQDLHYFMAASFVLKKRFCFQWLSDNVIRELTIITNTLLLLHSANDL